MKYLFVCFFTLTVYASAADKYWVGSTPGNWDTTSPNWATNSGGTPTTWSDGDNAIIEGSGGTITLTADVNISNLHVVSNDYTFANNTLAFAPSGVISNSGSRFVLETGVTGSPDVYTMHALSTGDRMRLAPVSAPMILGTIYRRKDNYLRFEGAALGSTILAVDASAGLGNFKNNKNDMYGSGTWSVGDAAFGDLTMYGGTLILTGEVTLGWQDFDVRSGASLHLNNPGAITQSGKLNMNGGSLDNSSGSPVTTSTYNPDYSLLADTTFIGSQGTNSDLSMGTGTVSINASRSITVSNAAATLTIAGVIDSDGNPFSLTKEGAGTLALTANNAYLGDTIINAGTVRVAQAYMSDVGNVRFVDGAGLRLDYAGIDDVLGVYTNGVKAPSGTWGALSSGATNETASITGTGLLRVVEPTPLDGIRYWDGQNIGDVGNALSDGGNGTWSTSVTNWDAGAGVPRTTWNNATNDVAFFRGIAGTVTLSEDIYLGDLIVDSDGYTINGNVLHFTPGGSGMLSNSAAATITSGITGEPDVFYSRGSNLRFKLEPSSVSMALGTVTRLADDYIDLGGTTTNNTIVAMPKPAPTFGNSQNVKVHKIGSGTWTVNGELYGGQTWIYGGTLVCNGRLWESYQGVRLYSGTLIVNGTVERSVTYTAESGYAGDGTLGGTGVCLCAISVPTNGVIAPGYPTGTLTITNNPCTISGTLSITVDGEARSKLVVDGDLTVSNTATLFVDEISSPATHVVIADYSGYTLTGTFGVTNIPDNWQVEYAYAGGTAIALIPPARGTVLFVR